ncbi:MAG: hypothetical protein ACE5GC_07720 [Acidimicrobiia bacterium]
MNKPHTPQRLIAISFALVLLAAACSDDSDAAPTTAPTTQAPGTTEAATTTVSPSTSEATTTTPPTTVTILTTTTTSTTTTSTTQAPTTTTTAAGPLSIEIAVAEGTISGPGSIEIDLGTRVIVIVTADVADEVHLHGYNVFADVGPSSAAVIEFEAGIPGIFELELEDAGTFLLEIEVS